MQAQTENNEVEFLLDNEFFYAVHARLTALESAKPNDATFVRIAMWSADLKTQLPEFGRQQARTLKEALTALDEKGHQIRVVLWYGSTVSGVTGFKEHKKAVEFQKWASTMENVEVYIEPYKSAMGTKTSLVVGGVVSLGLGYLGYGWVPTLGLGVGSTLTGMSSFLGWGASIHQKLVIVCTDGKLDAIMGGFNLGSEYSCQPDHSIDKEYWHDTAVALTGPAAAVVNNEWVRRWNKQGESTAVEPMPPKAQKSKGGAKILIATTNSETNTRENDIRNLMVEHIRSAKKSIYIENYAFTDPGLLAALVERLAKKPKIPVVVMINHPKSQLFEANTTWSYFQANVYAALATANGGEGVMYAARTNNNRTSSTGKTYRCWPYPHSKLAIFDDETLVVGSANWTYRSMEYDGEISAFIQDKTIVPQIRKRLIGHWWIGEGGCTTVEGWIKGAAKNNPDEEFKAGCKIFKLRAEDFTDWTKLSYMNRIGLSAAWTMF